MAEEGKDRYPIDLLIEGICKRPDMYVMGGQFLDVVNFLGGFFTGLARSETDAEEVARFNGFCDWLHEKLDMPRSIAIWSEFRRRSLDDKAALEQFAAYWSEYKMAGHEREWMRVSREAADGC
jgi:hypothetical protein